MNEHLLFYDNDTSNHFNEYQRINKHTSDYLMIKGTVGCNIVFQQSDSLLIISNLSFLSLQADCVTCVQAYRNKTQNNIPISLVFKYINNIKCSSSLNFKWAVKKTHIFLAYNFSFAVELKIEIMKNEKMPHHFLKMGGQ